MSFPVEAARSHDLGAALELIRSADLPEEGVAACFGHFRLVKDTGRIIGVCGLEVHGHDGLLRSLAVAPGYRGSGVGALLVDEVFVLARKMELGSLYLLTTTARDYFLKRGFAECPREDAPGPIRESWEFESGCPTRATFMRRRVD